MQSKIIAHALLLTGLLLSSASFASFFKKWPNIPDPPQSEVAWVAENMTQNGVPMKIKNFSSRLGKKSITDFYMSKWSGSSGKKPVMNEAGEWTIIGKLEGKYLLTVQAKKNKNGSEGFLAISTLPAVAKADSFRTDTKFPRMPGTKLMSDTRSIDDGRVGKTLILKNNHSVKSNATFYTNRLKSKGWALDPMAAEADRNTVNTSYLYFRKNSESCTIAINKLKQEIGSTIVVNITNVSA